jgi:hypothetical protein
VLGFTVSLKPTAGQNEPGLDGEGERERKENSKAISEELRQELTAKVAEVEPMQQLNNLGSASK